MIRLISIIPLVLLWMGCSTGPSTDGEPTEGAPVTYDTPVIARTLVALFPTPTGTQSRALLNDLTTAFGDEVFGGFDGAIGRFGWNPLCSTDDSLKNPLHGIVETEPEGALPRLRLLYSPSSSHTPMVFIQQPDSYDLPEEQGVRSSEDINGFTVSLWEDGNRAGASFETGESAESHRIVATVFGRDFGLQRIKEFIQSLTFECSGEES
jgi:hypothetical protein